MKKYLIPGLRQEVADKSGTCHIKKHEGFLRLLELYQRDLSQFEGNPTGHMQTFEHLKKKILITINRYIKMY